MTTIAAWTGALLAVVVLVTACTAPTELSVDSDTTSPPDPLGQEGPIGASGYRFPPSPALAEGPLEPATVSALDQLVSGIDASLELDALSTVIATGDSRLGWVVADLLRLFQIGRDGEALIDGFERLTSVSLPDSSEYHPWQAVTDHMIAWDLPAPPGYQDTKRKLFTQVEPAWEPFLADRGADVDWRLVSWGGVFIDDRPLGDTGFCPKGCIPALDDPVLTDATGGAWYPNANIIFGVVVNDEAIALPKHMMEVHEMVNLSIGGRRLGIPYCTLCGSAQAYFLDGNPAWDDDLVLRTSGLLSRSNKMMFELGSYSLIDTFTGVATSGPLHRAGLVLEQTTVVASTWGEWQEEHPATAIIAEDGGLGRRYLEDPLQGRDAAGPIFPVGDVDPRLPAQTLVVGVISPDATAVAFPADLARSVAQIGEPVGLADIRLISAGSGFRAETDSGDELVAHQAFWFAWSQFHPETLIWTSS
jgi:hypothetical protein